MTRALTLTTISSPDNACLRALSQGASAHKIPFFIAGDTRSPPGFSLAGAHYLSLDEQIRRFPAFAALLPHRHYARKNIAYLAAMEVGAEEIQEVDDDNFPRESFWQTTAARPWAVRCARAQPWANVYSLFTRQSIWPRGFPLEFCHTSPPTLQDNISIDPPLILQGLADENPDVDAVFRMTRDLPVSFDHRDPVMLSPGSWCPFNSQNTLFHRRVFALLYLPSYCSFRMTDIWRSLIAQRCLWELKDSKGREIGVVFHQATVSQRRNEHNLLQDFADEVPGYLLNEKMRVALEACRLDPADLTRNIILCYEKLIENQFLPAAEMPLLREWCDAIGKARCD